MTPCCKVILEDGREVRSNGHRDDKIFPDGADWRDHAPLGVACVAPWHGIGEMF